MSEFIFWWTFGLFPCLGHNEHCHAHALPLAKSSKQNLHVMSRFKWQFWEGNTHSWGCFLLSIVIFALTTGHKVWSVHLWSLAHNRLLLNSINSCYQSTKCALNVCQSPEEGKVEKRVEKVRENKEVASPNTPFYNQIFAAQTTHSCEFLLWLLRGEKWVLVRFF